MGIEGARARALREVKAERMALCAQMCIEQTPRERMIFGEVINATSALHSLCAWTMLHYTLRVERAESDMNNKQSQPPAAYAQRSHWLPPG